jgi:hypothetical protein
MDIRKSISSASARIGAARLYGAGGCVAGICAWLAMPLLGFAQAMLLFLGVFALFLGGWAFLLEGAPAPPNCNQVLRTAREETQAVLNCLAEAFQTQLQQADLELEQTQSLLKDAIEHLTASFSNIHNHVSTQHRLALTQAAHPQNGDKDAAIDQALEISLTLEQDINTAIRSLQFQDISSQLIEHARHRLWAMNEALGDVDVLAGDGEDESLDFIDNLYRHKETIMLKVSLLDEQKTNPVSQGKMDTGEIELF